MPRAVRDLMEKCTPERRTLRELPLFGADDPVERRGVERPISVLESNGAEPRLSLQHPIQRPAR